MAVGEQAVRRNVTRATVLALLVVAYAALGFYFHIVLHTHAVYTHFAYVPIVLAGMWYGPRGIPMAALLAAIPLSFRLMGYGVGEAWSDVARVLLFFAVAICVGELSQKINAIQEALRQSEEKYRLIIDKSLAGIFLYRDDRILFSNSRLGLMLGYSPGDLVGTRIWDLIYEPDRPRVQQLVAKREAEGFADLRYECRLVTKGGSIIWADVASSVANYEGQPAVLVNVYDITDRKESEERHRELRELAQKQEEQLVHSTRLAELGEMAAGVAHELNQPLTGIRNFARNAAYMLDKGVGNPDEVKDNLRLISEQVDRAAKIINQMRELTRRSAREFAPLDLSNIVRESVEFLSPQLRLSGVHVQLDLARNLPQVMGDRIRLEQVFLNLLTNARQAMEETAERRLTVKTRLDPAGRHPVVVEIIDTGKGFAPAEAEKLFQPFFSTKKPGHGTGLGLSISLSIVKDHQGTIEASGEPGKGAKFTVRLPANAEASRLNV
jgi:PAS domain S-box-containing protein